ncbi:shikimate kinase [Amycolatopsis cihanbeyliensis]|uniref:Shikimate kinase n=1 Tax=Amycolatopsis cihanbeyliensis TaxID=1128664 RepID=A0A542CT48_AMYCI|nr:shikimate kinase [Amycolatopsis cihanbeyliensis]TQI93960.1 shikimate kinase [Amycolatopsis cihanbeyliensis]
MVRPRAVLIGPPGSGKSTVGRLLAERLGTGFLDSDDAVEARAGRTISEIFTAEGEPAFRELERAAIATALEEHGGVLALGGGAVLAEETRRRLAAHKVVFLAVGMSEGVRRTGMSTARPLLTGVNPRATYKALLDARLPIYREVAMLEIDTDERAPGEVADAVLELLGEADPPAEPDRTDTAQT